MEDRTVAQHALNHGATFPYDAPDEWWESGGLVPPSATDWAHSAARGILSDLNDRRGIKRGFEDLDEDIRSEITLAIADIIRAANTIAAQTPQADALRKLLREIRRLAHPSGDDCFTFRLTQHHLATIDELLTEGPTDA